MDGASRVVLQEKAGVRARVKAIDALRIFLGVCCVQTLTPIVEEKLRRGEVPRRPLKLLFSFPLNKPETDSESNTQSGTLLEFHEVQCILTLKSGYPVECDLEWEIDIDDVGLPTVRSQLNTLVRETSLLGHQDNDKARHSEGCVVEFARLLHDLVNARDVMRHRNANEDGQEDGRDEVAKTELSLVVDSQSQFQNVLTNIEDDEDNHIPETLSATAGTFASIEEEASSNPQHYYTCRRCRQVLFTDIHLDHASPVCTQNDVHYLKPPPDVSEWICVVTDAAISKGESGGKLVCPDVRCTAKLGTFDWVGRVCKGCGEWIAPLFQISRSAVDRKQK